MLLDAKLSKSFWAEAAMTAVYLINRIPKSKNVRSANEKWYNKEIILRDLKIFGEKVYAYIPKEKRDKLEEKSEECIFMGYTSNGYRLYNLKKTKIVIARDVIFSDNEIFDVSNSNCEEETANKNFIILMNKQESYEEDERQTEEYIFDGKISAGDVPLSYEEAVTSQNWNDWKLAMEEEYEALLENNTWHLEVLPEGKKPIKNKWVYAVKRDVNDNIVRFKARLVAKGYSQVKGIDYEETFSPVVKYTSIRMLLAIAAHNKLKITQLDAVTAFLNGKLNEVIYMEQPIHFNDGSTKYCKLDKCIYGLKQSSRVWNMTLDQVLVRFGLQRSTYDQCIYFNRGEKYILILAIYVDDILIFTNNDEIEKNLCEELSKNFKMKNLGPASSILGIRIIRNYELGTISIDQSHYIREVLRRFGMIDCNPVSTPLEPGIKISKNTEANDQMQNIPYRGAIGSLLFIAITTRTDIAFSVNLLSRYCENPNLSHWQSVKRIMRYLKGTIEMKLIYGKNDNQITGFTDADWAGDLDSRKSTSGYVFTLYGGAISWNTKRQATVALSSTESEYMSAVLGIQEAIWLKALYSEIFLERSMDIPFYVDNKGAIHLLLNNAVSSRTKHIKIKVEFIRNAVHNGEVKIEYLETKEMPADILTKSVSANIMMKHLPAIGLEY